MAPGRRRRGAALKRPDVAPVIDWLEQVAQPAGDIVEHAPR
jgi:hypothetical protein